jgi:ABC-2 type transport system permease protein
VTTETVARSDLDGAAIVPASFGPLGILRVVTGAARASAATRLRQSGVVFYLLVWVSFPLFNLLMVALIYRNDPSLRNYAIIGGAGMAFLFSMQFNAAEILDGQRFRGTLGNLFLAPSPRYAWLGGFQLVAVCEALFTASVSVAVGKAIFGLPLDVDPLGLVVSVVLLIAALWGFSMILGAIGVGLRNANQLSNLVFPLIQIVAGTMYPIAALPTWVRIPAHCLPFGYGLAAIDGALTRGQDVSALASDLLPLLGFAVTLPILGIIAFRAIERRSRVQGSLELV